MAVLTKQIQFSKAIQGEEREEGDVSFIAAQSHSFVFLNFPKESFYG